MSTAELKELVTSILLSQKKTSLQMEQTDLRMRDTDLRMRDTDLQMKDTDLRMKETDRQLKELGKQIGGLGNKFGTFTEGMAYRSLEKILTEKFGMNDFIAPRVKVRRDGQEEEYDILAYSDGSRNEGMVVEIKSTLRPEDIAQMARKMESFFQFMPVHRGKTFHGMIAYVSGTSEIRQLVLENGWHLAHIGGDLFELENPANFLPKSYVANS